VIRIAPVGLLPAHLHAGDGLACALNGLNELFDLLRDGWHRLANRAADMIGYRNTTNFRKALIDVHVPAIERKKRKPYRCRVIDQLKLRQAIVCVRIVRSLFRKRGGRSASRPDVLQLFRFVHFYSANKA